MNLSKYRTHDRYNISGVGKVVESEYAFELLKTNNRRCSAHEPYYGCMRQEIHDKP